MRCFTIFALALLACGQSAETAAPRRAALEAAAPAREAGELLLDARADGAALFGTELPPLPNADHDRVLALRASGLALADTHALDARFFGEGVLVLRRDHRLVYVQGEQERVLDEGVEGPLSVSGEHVAYVKGEMPFFEVAVATLAGARVVTQGMAPAWNPTLEGERLVFVSGAEGEPALHEMPRDGGAPHALPGARVPSGPSAARLRGDTLTFEDEAGVVSVDLRTGATVRDHEGARALVALPDGELAALRGDDLVVLR